MEIKEGGKLDGLLKRISVNMAVHDKEMARLERIRRMFITGKFSIGPYRGEGELSTRQELAEIFYDIVGAHLPKKYSKYGTRILAERELEDESNLVTDEEIPSAQETLQEYMFRQKFYP